MTDTEYSSTSKATERWVLALTSLGFFMAMMDSMIVTTASTSIRADFAISVSQLQWLLNAYNITIAALLLVGVAYGSAIGHRTMFIIGLMTFTLGSACCALSPTYAWLIASRIAQGVGASVMAPMSMAILSAAVPPERRGRALGICSGIGGLALIVGPSLGGVVVTALSWRWIFWINIPIGMAAVLLSLKQLPTDVGSRIFPHPFDSILSVFAPAALVYLLSQSSAGSLSATAVIIGVAGMVCAVVFIVLQRDRRDPLVPLRMFGSITFNVGALGNFLLYAAMFGTVFFLPQYFHVSLGADALSAGLQLLPWTGTLVVVSPFAGKWADESGERVVSLVGFMLQTIGYAWMAFAMWSAASYAQFAVALVVCGTGISMAGPALQKAMLGSVSREDMAHASGLFNLSRQLGGAVGVAVSVVVFQQFGDTTSSAGFASGVMAVMAMCAVLCLICVAASALMPARI